MVRNLCLLGISIKMHDKAVKDNIGGSCSAKNEALAMTGVSFSYVAYVMAVCLTLLQRHKQALLVFNLIHDKIDRFPNPGQLTRVRIHLQPEAAFRV